MSSNDLFRCPRCQGSTFDPDGGDCQVCHATGALRGRASELVDYEEAAEFIRQQDEERPRRLFR